MNHIQDTIPRIITVQATVCSSWNRGINSGQYAAVAGYNGRVIYEKTARDPNGKYWYMRWIASTNRWQFEYAGRPLRSGSSAWGQVLTDLDFDTPGSYKNFLFQKIVTKLMFFTGYDIRDVVQSRANCIYTMSGEG